MIMTEIPPDLTCWVLTNGMAGFETQAIGVAEALGLTPIVKRVAPRAPYNGPAPRGPAQPQPNIARPGRTFSSPRAASRSLMRG